MLESLRETSGDHCRRGERWQKSESQQYRTRRLELDRGEVRQSQRRIREMGQEG
jgi:hypothetical protein